MRDMPFCSPLEFESCVSPKERSADSPAHWFVFRGDRLLVELGPPSPQPSDDLRVPSRPAWARLADLQALRKSESVFGSSLQRTLYLGRLGGADCWAAELPTEAGPPPDAFRFESLRTLFSVLEDAHFALAGRAVQLIDWDRNHRFCGRCAAPTVTRAAERARECPACGLSSYPRIAPAVMALVRRGHKLLLARGPHFPPGMYSALAGFAEAGESLEQCLAREVAEEVGVQVSQIRYFASQPWPFPNSLMVAFHCEWAGGEIRPQDGEIESAGWFDVSQLPTLPGRISIARRLIDSAVSELKGPLE